MEHCFAKRSEILVIKTIKKHLNGFSKLFSSVNRELWRDYLSQMRPAARRLTRAGSKRSRACKKSLLTAGSCDLHGHVSVRFRHQERQMTSGLPNLLHRTIIGKKCKIFKIDTDSDYVDFLRLKEKTRNAQSRDFQIHGNNTSRYFAPF